jgi:hypothetical protein
LACYGADLDSIAQWNHGRVTLLGDAVHPTLLATLVDWVEKGAAPSSVTATRRANNVIERTMPVWPT